MSDGQGQGSSNPQGGDQNGQGTGTNPAWNDLLGVIPEDIHSQVIPHLENWDKEVQGKLEKYNGWDDVVDSGNDPDDAKFALELLQAVNDQPQQVIQALQEYNGIDPEPQGNGNAAPQAPVANSQSYDEEEEMV